MKKKRPVGRLPGSGQGRLQTRATKLAPHEDKDLLRYAERFHGGSISEAIRCAVNETTERWLTRSAR